MGIQCFLFAAGPVIMSIEEKMEADGRSIYVGNVWPIIFILYKLYSCILLYLYVACIFLSMLDLMTF